MLEILSGCVIGTSPILFGIVVVQIISEFGLLYEPRGGMKLHKKRPLRINPANILHPFYASYIRTEHF